MRLSLWLYEVQPAFREQNAQATPSPSTRRHCFVHEGTQCQWVNVRERCTGETVPLHSSPPDPEPHKNPMFVMVRESRNNRTETPPVSFPEDGSKTTQWALGIGHCINDQLCRRAGTFFTLAGCLETGNVCCTTGATTRLWSKSYASIMSHTDVSRMARGRNSS